jgi:hypothetical protein
MVGLHVQRTWSRRVGVPRIGVLGVVLCAVVVLAANSGHGGIVWEPMIITDRPAAQAKGQQSEVADSAGADGDLIQITYCGWNSDKPMPCVFIGTSSVSKERLTQPGCHLVYESVVSISTFDSLAAIVSAFEVGQADRVIDSGCCYNFVLERDSSEAVYWVLDCTEAHRLAGEMLEFAKEVDDTAGVAESLDNLWRRTSPWE